MTTESSELHSDPAARLLERDGELGQLEAALTASAGGDGQVVAIVGPGGIGKTTLLDAGVRFARAQGAEVLRAGGNRLERDFPFGVVYQLFDTVVARERTRRRGDVLSGAVALAAPLFAREQPTSVFTTEPTGVFHGLFWLASNLAEHVPLVLAIDDAHWADRISLEFLHYFAQRVQDLPVCVVLGSRVGEAPTRDGLVGELTHDRRTTTLSLAPLSADAVGQVVRSRLPAMPDEVAWRCAEITAGNPFLLKEVLGALERDRVQPATAAEHLRTVAPESVIQFVLARLAALPGGAQPLARAVAVLGEDAPLHLAATLADLPSDEAAEAADALVSSEILVWRRGLSFTHPLVRSAVYSDFPRARRGIWHRRAAGLLADGSARPEKVALQLSRTEPASDPWVVEMLRRAATSALAEGSPATALEHLRRALAEPPPPDQRTAVLVALGRAETDAGDANAADRFLEVTQRVAAGPERAAVLLDLGRAYFAQVKLEEAIESFDRGLAELGETEHELRAELVAAWVGVTRLDPHLRARALERLAPLVQTLEHPVTHAERVLLAHAAEALLFAGEDREQALSLARRALGNGTLLAEETTDGMNWMVALGVLGWSDDFEMREQEIEWAMADARRRGSILGYAEACYARSFNAYYAGRLADAVADAQQAVDAEQYGWRRFVPAARARLALALTERGDLGAASDALEPAELAPPSTRTSLHVFILEARARLMLLEGRAQDAVDLLLPLEPLARLMLAPNPAPLPWRSRMGLAAAAAGQPETGERLVCEEVELARRYGAPRSLGMALRAHGVVVQGVQGIESLREAVETLERSPAALEHCRALVDLGAALRRHGKRTEAQQRLRSGLDMAHRFGAVLLERQAREELLAAGARPRRAALRGVDALTPSERRTVGLAATGLTNREIAQMLFVTLRTVEAHLSRAYEKLGISSRAELSEAMLAATGTIAETPAG